MRISDWSSDVCSSDLVRERLGDEGVGAQAQRGVAVPLLAPGGQHEDRQVAQTRLPAHPLQHLETAVRRQHDVEDENVGRLAQQAAHRRVAIEGGGDGPALARSEEHTSELQSLMRISYAV